MTSFVHACFAELCRHTLWLVVAQVGPPTKLTAPQHAHTLVKWMTLDESAAPQKPCGWSGSCRKRSSCSPAQQSDLDNDFLQECPGKKTMSADLHLLINKLWSPMW